jgi:hypothetical protein
VTTEPSRRQALTWRRHVPPGLAVAVAAIALLRPLVAPGPTVVPDMDDAYFNIWRLAWIAHQLVRDPTHLFDANIFHPSPNTLAYSDALLLVGLAGAPFIWLGVPVAIVHNGLLVAAFVTSGWAMYALALRLTGDRIAATIAGMIVAIAPYRFAHVAHLELQWLVWMPLALLAVHRLVERPGVGAGLALGACLAGQLLCSIYYGVFLCLFTGVAWIALVVAHRPRPGLVTATAAAAIPLVLVAVPYLRPYAASRAVHGPRSVTEVAEYSAVPADYLRGPALDALRGRHDTGPAPEERTLYPGTLAIVFAAIGLVAGRRERVTWVYAALAVVAVDASLGVHGVTWRVLQTVAPPLGNLRAPARFGSLVLIAIASLAAFGAARVTARLGSKAWVGGLAVLALMVGEASFRQLPTRLVPVAPSPVDRWLASLPADTVLLELPVPRTSRLWGYETTHQVRSIFHWRLLVNGYSGFLPASYANTLVDLETFPDAPSIARLRRLGVDAIVVRRANFASDDAYARVTTPLLTGRDFGPPNVVGDGRDEAVVFELKPGPP